MENSYYSWFCPHEARKAKAYYDSIFQRKDFSVVAVPRLPGLDKKPAPRAIDAEVDREVDWLLSRT